MDGVNRALAAQHPVDAYAPHYHTNTASTTSSHSPNAATNPNDVITLIGTLGTSLSGLLYFIYHHQSQRSASLAQAIPLTADQWRLQQQLNGNAAGAAHDGAVYTVVTGNAKSLSPHSSRPTWRSARHDHTSSSSSTATTLHSQHTPSPINLLWHHIIRTTTYIKLLPLFRLPWFEYSHTHTSEPAAVDFQLLVDKHGSSRSQQSVHVGKQALLTADKYHLYGNTDAIPSPATATATAAAIQRLASVTKPIEHTYKDTLLALKTGRVAKVDTYEEYGIADDQPLTAIGYVKERNNQYELLAQGEYGDSEYNNPTIISNKSYARLLADERSVTQRLRNALVTSVGVSTVCWAVVIARNVYQIYTKNLELARLLELQQMREAAVERRREARQVRQQQEVAAVRQLRATQAASISSSTHSSSTSNATSAGSDSEATQCTSSATTALVQPSLSRQTSNEDERNLCAICAEGKATCVLLNCFHQATCIECSEQLIARNFKCPICRSPIITYRVPIVV